MRAVVYKKPFEVAVESVPDPKILHPNDVIVKITSSCICGLDLHMYEGRTAAAPGIVFGHENMGVIEEVGGAVKERKVGDRVVLPFNVEGQPPPESEDPRADVRLVRLFNRLRESRSSSTISTLVGVA